MVKNLRVDLKRETIALIANVTYKNEKAWYGETERPLHMSLLVPKHKENHSEGMPLLVWLCGGGLSVVDHNIWLPQMVWFSERGFVVASVEYRTSNDVSLPAALIDVKAAIRYLKSHSAQYCIDPENVFAMGESAGGMLASLTGVTAGKDEYEQGDFLEWSSAVNAVIDVYGVADLRRACETAEEGSGRQINRLREAGLTPDDTDWSKLDEFSAIRYVNENTVPFLILHGTKDEKVDISQSEAFYDRLTECGVPCDYYRLVGCIHGEDRFYQEEVLEIVREFMVRNMKQKLKT